MTNVLLTEPGFYLAQPNLFHPTDGGRGKHLSVWQKKLPLLYVSPLCSDIRDILCLSLCQV